MIQEVNIDTINHVAILQTAFLGDVALSLFLVQKIKIINPKVKITFITTKAAAVIARCSKAIDQVIVFDKKGSEKSLHKTIEFAKNLKIQKFDIMISLHKSLRSFLVVKNSGAEIKAVFDNSVLSFLVGIRVKYYPHMHEILRNFQFLNLFYSSKGIDVDIPNISLKLDDIALQLEIDDNKTNIVLAPSSVWQTKRWPEIYFKTLTEILVQKGYNVYLIGGKEDYTLCEYIRGNTNAVVCAGSLSIPQSIKLLQKADVLVTNDSAPTHFAAMTNTATVCIYGATDPEFGFYPIKQKHIIAEKSDLKCRPCAIHGQKQCPLGHFKCMNDMKPEYIENLVEKLLQY